MDGSPYYIKKEGKNKMICKKCGHENTEDSNFCQNCGADLREAYQPSRAEAVQETAEETREEATGEPREETAGEPMGEMPGETGLAQTEVNRGQTDTNTGYGSGSSSGPAKGPVYQNPGQSDATASMILGIVSIVMCSSSVLAMIAGVMAIVIANKAKRQGCENGATQAGTICGIIGICLGGITTLIYIGSFMWGFFSAMMGW